MYSFKASVPEINGNEILHFEFGKDILLISRNLRVHNNDLNNKGNRSTFQIFTCNKISTY